MVSKSCVIINVRISTVPGLSVSFFSDEYRLSPPAGLVVSYTGTEHTFPLGVSWSLCSVYKCNVLAKTGDVRQCNSWPSHSYFDVFSLFGVSGAFYVNLNNFNCKRIHLNKHHLSVLHVTLLLHFTRKSYITYCAVQLHSYAIQEFYLL